MRVPENYEPHPLLMAPRPTPIDPNDAYIEQLLRQAAERELLPTAAAIPLPRGATVSGGLGPNRILGA